MLQRPLNRNGSFPHPGDYDNDVEDKDDVRNGVNDDDDDVEDKVDGKMMKMTMTMIMKLVKKSPQDILSLKADRFLAGKCFCFGSCMFCTQ